MSLEGQIKYLTHLGDVDLLFSIIEGFEDVRGILPKANGDASVFDKPGHIPCRFRKECLQGFCKRVVRGEQVLTSSLDDVFLCHVVPI